LGFGSNRRRPVVLLHASHTAAAAAVGEVSPQVAQRHLGITARVTVGDSVRSLHGNESICVPNGARHRLENPGKIDQELIEVQTGSYLGKDDILRIEDEYHRVSGCRATGLLQITDSSVLQKCAKICS
jgi:hypothetical protein